MQFDMVELNRRRQEQLDREVTADKVERAKVECQVAKKIQQNENACFEQLQGQYVKYGTFLNGGKCYLGEFSGRNDIGKHLESKFPGIQCTWQYGYSYNCYITEKRFMKQ